MSEIIPIKKLPHCILKVHKDGSCVCTIKTPDPGGNPIGNDSHIEVINGGGPPIKMVEQPLPETPIIHSTTVAMQKVICLQCNVMYDITEDLQTITCKCGHKISILVKRNG